MANYKKQVRELIKLKRSLFKNDIEFIEEIDKLLNELSDKDKYQKIFYRQVKRKLMEDSFPELNNFINDNNVICINGLYMTQCSQFSIKMNFGELVKYFKKEYN